ncbi:MAG: DUF58 domain-containing protein [Planctomycetales bacterium]|nr:DUF58 domain-containing protein [Planctomycetales bacterium]
MQSISARLVNSILVPLLAIGNHDFCPWANRYVYWLKQPIGWFCVGAAAAALTAVFLEPRVWVIFGSLVAVMTLGVVWPWLAMRGATAEIGFDRRRCREGDRVQVSLSIHNRWPCPLWGLAIENGFFLEATEGETRPVAALARAAAWSRSEFLFEFRPDARGVYPHSAPELVTGFPFGIWRASRRISVSRELVVWPKTTPLTSIPSLGGDIADVIGMLFDRPGNEGDMIGVRPYRDGDRLRSIHWAQTARRDSLIVTERQAAARRWIVIAVDIPAFCNTSLSAVGLRRQQLEMAIRVSASIAREFHAHHADVRFVIGDTDLCVSPDASGLHQLLDALARFQIQPESFRPPTGFGRKSLAIVVTTDQRRSEWERESGLRGSLRLVLIDAANPAREVDRNVWINIESDSDGSHQLRHQWERVCHATAAK